jgi:uncharacterized protein (TIGR00297 family)
MIDPIAVNLAIGAILSTILAILSVRVHSLDVGGGFAAVIIGTIVFGNGAWPWYTVLLSFFISSTILTRFKHSAKSAKGIEELKAGARNFWQAVGQGGIAALSAGVAILLPNHITFFGVGFVSALAEANADTWAVELGVLSARNPRLITKLSEEVLPGTSGGISVLGEFSAVAGSLFVSLTASVLGVFGSVSLILVLAAAIAAVTGEHIDSLLGATVQATYYCPACKKETERRIHKCGTATQHIRGFHPVTNEAVNFISTGLTAIVAMTLCLLL